MRMLTLNCHSLLDYDSDKQIQEIVDQIVREEIDVLSLQQINHSLNRQSLKTNWNHWGIKNQRKATQLSRRTILPIGYQER